MGFYIRKSISVGPFRFNLSKSGVGISTGIKGFRVGMSPRGTYVHVGRDGLYYRVTVPHSGPRRPPRSIERPFNPDATQPIRNPDPVVMHAIESVETISIEDSSSADLVAEMNAKRKRIRFWPLVLLGTGGLCIAAAQLNAPRWVMIAAGAIGLAATLAVAIWDQLRKTTVLMYELEPEIENKLEQLQTAIKKLASCGGTWHVSAKGRVTDWKRNAGAGHLVSRRGIRIGTVTNPAYVKTNVATPSIPVGRQTLYFFPDKVLVFEPHGVGAVSYENLNVHASPTQFIESESVPRDATIVDYTWRFVNKKGGPDRRFNNNRRLPITLYEDISFTSSSGLNELIQISRTGCGSDLQSAIAALSPAQSG